MYQAFAFRALMWRNVVYRVRNWIGTILEVLLPIAFVAILVAIKSAVENSGDGIDSKVIPADFPNATEAFTALTFNDYLTAIRAERVCLKQAARRSRMRGPPRPPPAAAPEDEEQEERFVISGIDVDGYNWQVPMVKCDSRQCSEEGQNARELFCEYGILAVAASDWSDIDGQERAADFVQYLYDRYDPVLSDLDSALGYPLVRTFTDVNQIGSYVSSSDEYGRPPNHPKITMAISFRGNDPNFYSYTLHPNSTNFNAPEQEARPVARTTPPTKLLNSFAKHDEDTCLPEGGTPDQGKYQDSCTGQYLYNGVLTFQRLVQDYILNRSGASEAGYAVAEAGVSFVPFPHPSYETNGFYATIQTIGPLLVVLGLLYPVAAMITYVVREKQLRQKEIMKMMSVEEAEIGWSWFLTFFSLHIVTAICAAGVSSVLYGTSQRVILLVFWILTYLAVIVYSMLVATLTCKTTRAILMGLLVFFLGVFLTLAVDVQTGDSGLLRLISLHPVAAFSYGLQEIGYLEDSGVGLTSSTMHHSDHPSGYNFGRAIRSLMVDSILWGIVTWYLNRVIKPDYGQALPMYFPFQLSYWLPGRGAKPRPQQGGGAQADPTLEKHRNQEEYRQKGVPVEPVGVALERQSAQGKNIQIRGLRKVFGDKVAVDGLTLSMYSGQITALLGHNGAGKTTTMNVLTGAMKPTEGYATIAGKDIRFQSHEIRKHLGICPQHDCLFPMLTVREHVQFFARLKGLYSNCTKKYAEKKVDQAIQDVALMEKRNTLSKNLSGGQKRKLSVALAFCGGSKIVLLDEPTSGMDPFSRRFTWNVIRQYRKNRCIILTTHFMDEADILGDRIAIMAEGRLRCAGSSLFLKKTYGVGYQLTIEKDQTQGLYSARAQHPNHGTIDPVVIPVMDDLHSNDAVLEEIVMGSVGSATLLTNVGAEMTFQLPMGASAQFGPMFDGLDGEIDRGTISSYGLSITTLDEVFLLVARGETKQDRHYFSSSCRDLTTSATWHSGTDASEKEHNKSSSRSRMNLAKDGLFRTHVGALFKKRAANFRRDKKAWCCTTLVPSLFVLIGFVVFKFASPVRDLEPIVLSLDDYNPDVIDARQPRNPIAYNNPGRPYLCQPGTCAYQEAVVVSRDTNEEYFFCGYQARLDQPMICSIDESRAIAERITDADAGAKGVDVTTVLQSSLSLYNTSKDYKATQYGAIWYTHELNSTTNMGISYGTTVLEECIRNQGNYTSMEDCFSFGGIGYLIQYNFTAVHIAPLFQALADEALVREAIQSDKFQIQCSIDPLPITKVEESLASAQDVFLAWFLVVLSFPFIAGSFGNFITAERASKAKHLQTVAGVQPMAYWLSTYLWDVMNYQIPMWLVVVLMFAFDVKSLTSTERGIVSAVIMTLWLFGPATAGFTYCLSFAFSSPELFNVFLIILGFLVALGGSLTKFILLLIGNDPGNFNQSLIDAASIVTWILRFIPAFNLGKGLFFIINIDTIDYLEGEKVSAWSEPVLLIELIFLAWQSVGYLLLAVQLDKWSTNPRMMSLWQSFTSCMTCGCCCSAKDNRGGDITVALPDDDDVMAEQKRVLSGDANGDLIVASQLTKVYDNGKVAVNGMSLGIPAGQCFGLLGINGAGKTTTMGMLTAEFPPTSGDATLAGFSVANEPEKTRRRIGYCPQFDAHFANMTGREHVELYASIKGVPRAFVEEAAAAKLKEVGLNASDSDRLSSGYSGGMKRRLSLACATIGQPQIVFLDECSTGVDPVARREIWQLVSDMVVDGNLPPEQRTSVILTTHSMEECEALCPRIGIMAHGRLRCLGSAQHLKNKFGQGFQIEIKVKLLEQQDEDYLEIGMALARTRNAAAVMDEEGGNKLPQGVFFNLQEVVSALQALTEDDFLSSMITAEDPLGYNIWKDAQAGMGVPLDAVAAFCTGELRMDNVANFVAQHWPNHILRERQDSKVRYEVSSEGIRISSIFATIEEYKESLQLADYGVSQTSLEQVFNMHAEEAEGLKQGRNDR